MMVSPASRELVTPQRLRAFFAPESIALVGASDNSGWARFIVASCAATGFDGPLTAVHPRAGTAFGLPVVPSLRDLPGPADLAFILAPVHAVEGVLDDMGAANGPPAATGLCFPLVPTPGATEERQGPAAAGGQASKEPPRRRPGGERGTKND